MQYHKSKSEHMKMQLVYIYELVCMYIHVQAVSQSVRPQGNCFYTQQEYVSVGRFDIKLKHI